MGNVFINDIVNFADDVAGAAHMVSGNTPKATLPDGREIDLMSIKYDRVQSLRPEFGLENVDKLHAQSYHRGKIYITLDFTSNWTVYFGFEDYCGSTNIQCGFNRDDTPEAIYFRLKERLTDAQRRAQIGTLLWNREITTDG